MIRRSSWLSALAVGLFAVSGSWAAKAQSSYGGVALGTATYFDDNNLEYDYFGFVVAGQFGLQLSPTLRTEAELAYQSTEAEIENTNIDVDVTAFRGSISGYYDFVNISFGGLTPYAGGGFGITSLEFEDDDETELSAHFEAGGSLRLTQSLDIVPAARWELTDDASNIQFRVGTRFWF